MSIADDLIEKKLNGGSNAELAESLLAVAELLGQQVGELTGAAKDREFSSLQANAATIRDVAAMLDGVVDEVGS